MTRPIESENLAPRKRGRHPLLSVIIFVVGGMLFVFLLTTVNLDKIIANFHNTVLFFILLSVAVRLLLVIVRVIRWKLLFKAQGIHFSLFRLVDSQLISRFVGHLTPMGIGVQAFRIADTTRLTDKKIKSLVSTNMITVINVFVSVPIAILMLLVNWRNPQYISLKWGILGVSMLLGLGWIIFWRLEPLIITTIKKIHILDKWSLSERASRLCNAVRIYQHPENHGLLVQVFFLSVCIKGLNILKTYFDISAFNIHVSMSQLAALSSVWALITIIPVIPQSLGVGDGVRMSIFSLLGIPADSALSIVLLQRGLILGIDLMGGVALLIRSMMGLLSSKE